MEAFAAPECYNSSESSGEIQVALWTRIGGLVKYGGLRRSIRAALHALKFRDFHIFAIRRDELAPAPALPAGVEIFTEATARLRAARAGRTGLPSEFWRDEITGAAQCAMVEMDGEPAGVIWAEEFPAQRPIVVLAPGEAELTGAYVIERFRRRGLYRALLHAAAAWQLRKRERVFLVVDGNAPELLKLATEIGFREIVAIERRAVWGAKFFVAQMRVKDLFEPRDPN
ncbi:MAG: GNAT family N-acetyltransferase [Candidatus Binataceae bacterium]